MAPAPLSPSLQLSLSTTTATATATALPCDTTIADQSAATPPPSGFPPDASSSFLNIFSEECKNKIVQACATDVEKEMDAKLSKFKQAMRMEINERLKSMIRSYLTSNMRNIQDRTEKTRRRMRLQFRNKIPRTILTGEEIKGEGNTCVEVALTDDKTENIIDVEAESSFIVEIVLLKAEFDASDEWTVEDFNENIVRAAEGKKPLLAGNVRLKLHRGVAILDNIKLRNHTTKIKPPVFRLGARVVDDTFDDCARVKEAKTESFTVKDFRNKYYMKHAFPSPSDEVSRLTNIRKGGPIDKRLRDDNIFTVRDFLFQLQTEPQRLKNVVNLGAKKWEATVKNARACLSNKRRYFNINSHPEMDIEFDDLGQVGEIISSENQYPPANIVCESHKADIQELLASSIDNGRGAIGLDDDRDPLTQNCTCSSTFVSHPQDSLNLLCSHSDRRIMPCESCNGHANSSVNPETVVEIRQFI